MKFLRFFRTPHTFLIQTFQPVGFARDSEHIVFHRDTHGSSSLHTVRPSCEAQHGPTPDQLASDIAAELCFCGRFDQRFLGRADDPADHRTARLMSANLVQDTIRSAKQRSTALEGDALERLGMVLLGYRGRASQSSIAIDFHDDLRAVALRAMPRRFDKHREIGGHESLVLADHRRRTGSC